MKVTNLQDHIIETTKALQSSIPPVMASNLCDYYYQNLYFGEENDKISTMYFDLVFFELLTFISQNQCYLKRNKKFLNKMKKFFKKELLHAKIVTYEKRKKIFLKWLGKDNKNCNSTDIVNYLIRVYPINQIKKVKRELDLLISLEDLKSQYEAL